MRRIHHHIGIGGVVDGGDLAMPDPNRFMHHLHHGGEAIGGAGCGGDNRVPRGIIQRIIHANHDIQHRCFLDRCSDNHALRPTIKMPAQGGFGQEFAAAFQHQINTNITPGNGTRRCMFRKTDAFLTNAQSIRAVGADRCAPAALHAIKTQQMRSCRNAALDFIHMHNIQPIGAARIILTTLRRAKGRAKRQPANAAHAINADPHAFAPVIGLPKASTRACSAIRSRVVKGRLMKISSRRRSAA